ncbi:hypothetical protein [Rhodopseudomonas palustris]
MLQLAILIGIAAPSSRAQAQWWSNKEPVDYEDCVAKGEANATTPDAKSTLQSHCDAKFAGRRKPGGGYSYYDFMQNRSFDIAGPNPTTEELRKIDEAYTAYLDERRRKMIAAAFAAKQQQIAALQQQQQEQRQAIKSPPLPRPRPVAGKPDVTTEKPQADQSATDKPKPRAAADRAKARTDKRQAARRRTPDPPRYACGSNDPVSCGLTQLSAGFSAVKTSLFGASTANAPRR